MTAVAEPTVAGRWSEPDPLGLRALPLVLMYHAVGTYAEDPHQLAVSPGRFDRQLGQLRRLGLRGVSMGELVGAMRRGRARGLVALTFDDGYADLIEHALPALRRHSFGATVFVIADRLGGTNEWDAGPVWPLLGEAGVRELAAAGVEIGAHGATHVPLAGADPRRLADEVAGSRATLGDLLGRPVDGFAYPYGSMDAAARAAVRAAGYTYGCAVEAGRTGRCLAAVPRMYVGERDTLVRLAVKRVGYRAHIALKAMRGGHQ